MFFNDLQIQKLISETNAAKELISSKNINNVHDLFKEINILPVAFQEFIKLVKIVLTLPVTTASNERFFSTLKLVKSYIRTTTGNERLSNLLLMFVEKEFIKGLDLEALIDDFGTMRPRRYPVN
jgi:hypothetical protein